MRTLLFFIPTNTIGGAETQLLTLCKNLDPKKYRLIVATVEHRLTAPFYVELSRYAKIESVNNINRLGQIIQYLRPDVIQHFHNCWIAPALDRVPFRTKTIEIVHGCLHFQNDSTSTPKHRTDYVVSVSKDAENFFLKSVPEFGDRCKVIPNGVDTYRFSGTRSLANDDVVRILHVGRLCEGDKKYRKIFEACAALDKKTPWELHCVGEGYDTDEIKSYARQLIPGKVVFHGYTQTPERFYQSADIYVSRSESEGFGLSIAEAAASGMAISMWDCGGIAPYFTNEFDAMVSKTDLEFKVALQTLVADAEARKEIGAQARQLALRRFSAKTMASEYDELYTEIIKTKAPPVYVRSTKKILGISNPNFSGVSNSVRAWVGPEHWLGVPPISPLERETWCGAIIDQKPEILVVGGDSGYLPLLEMIKKRTKTKILATWHASFSFSSLVPGDGDILASYIEALRSGIVDGIGFVREHMHEVVNHPRAFYFPNRIPKVQRQPRIDHGPGPHFGLFNSGYGWKNNQMQIAGASLIENATVHMVENERPVFAKAVGAKTWIHGRMERAYFHRVLGSMDCNMQASFTESFGLTFCESYRLGVPCLTSPSVAIAPELGFTQVSDPDNPRAIAEKLVELSKNPRVEEVNQILDSVDLRNHQIVESVFKSL